MAEQYALIVRLPFGTEHWYVNFLPQEGEVIERLGAAYVVLSVEPRGDGGLLVTLAHAPPESKAGEPPDNSRA